MIKSQLFRKKPAPSPAEQVLKKHQEKGVYTPHEVSRITCVIPQAMHEKVADLLKLLGLEAHIENGRTIREFIKPKRFGIPGQRIKLESTIVSVFRFSVPREHAAAAMEAVIAAAEIDTPGRGSIFSQDLIEFSKEPSKLNIEILRQQPRPSHEVSLLKNLSYVICVLSSHGAGEQLARTALELGICVPLLTFGSGSDIRDQLGLIRITISPEKEIVHLVMPQHDSDSIIRLLAEESKLDRPGRGYIYQTPVALGHVDTRMKIGKQNYAASIDQIIAAIDTLKMGTNWRKRLDAEVQQNLTEAFLPKNNCEISIVCEEDRLDELREVCLSVGATGAVTSRLTTVRPDGKGEDSGSLIRSEISVAPEIVEKVVDSLLDVSQPAENHTSRLQVLDSLK